MDAMQAHQHAPVGNSIVEMQGMIPFSYSLPESMMASVVSIC